jgi:hypothetical protein
MFILRHLFPFWALFTYPFILITVHTNYDLFMKCDYCLLWLVIHVGQYLLITWCVNCLFFKCVMLYRYRYSDMENTCMTASFHWEGMFRPIRLAFPTTEVIVPIQECERSCIYVLGVSMLVMYSCVKGIDVGHVFMC